MAEFLLKVPQFDLASLDDAKLAKARPDFKIALASMYVNINENTNKLIKDAIDAAEKENKTCSTRQTPHMNLYMRNS